MVCVWRARACACVFVRVCVGLFGHEKKRLGSLFLFCISLPLVQGRAQEVVRVAYTGTAVSSYIPVVCVRLGRFLALDQVEAIFFLFPRAENFAC